MSLSAINAQIAMGKWLRERTPLRYQLTTLVLRCRSTNHAKTKRPPLRVAVEVLREGASYSSLFFQLMRSPSVVVELEDELLWELSL